MSSSIVSNDGSDGVVKVGDDQAVSMQLLQDVYNEITGKTEKLTKSFRLNHQACFEDIVQLNSKITQLYEQYNIVGSNCAITLFHTDDAKEQFSSFDRFKLYDSSSLSPVENIRLKYNFLIILPKTNRPQSYDIEIDIHSRAAMHVRSEKEIGFPKRFIISLASQTGMIEIEYVDYTVARNFMVAIEHWFNGLPHAKPSRVLDFLKRHSEHIPFLFRYLSAAAIAAWFFANPEKWIPVGESGSTPLFQAALLSFSTIFILAGIATKLGNTLEAAIDRAQPISYLKLNRGDENAISELQSSNRKNYLKGAVSFALAVTSGLVATWIAAYLGIGT